MAYGGVEEKNKTYPFLKIFCLVTIGKRVKFQLTILSHEALQVRQFVKGKGVTETTDPENTVSILLIGFELSKWEFIIFIIYILAEWT